MLNCMQLYIKMSRKTKVQVIISRRVIFALEWQHNFNKEDKYIDTVSTKFF